MTTKWKNWYLRLVHFLAITGISAGCFIGIGTLGADVYAQTGPSLPPIEIVDCDNPETRETDPRCDVPKPPIVIHPPEKPAVPPEILRKNIENKVDRVIPNQSNSIFQPTN